METIFEHNVTDEEQENLYGFVTDRNYVVTHTKSQIKHYEMIYDLYHHLRKDEKMAQKYLDKIPNSCHKLFSILNVDFNT